MARVKKSICFTLFLIIFISCVGILPKNVRASSNTISSSNNSEWRDIDVSLRENNDIQVEKAEKTFSLENLANLVMLPVDAPLRAAFIGIEKVMLGFTSLAITWLSQSINIILTNGNDIANPKTNTGLVDIWTQVRNLSLSLLTLGLIIIAFANVLNIDTAKYGLQQMIPKIIFAIFMAYFSFFLARLILEICSALQMGLIGFNTQSDIFTNGTLSNLITPPKDFWQDFFLKNSLDLVAKGLFTTLIFIGVIFAMFWLTLVLIVRTAMIWILVAVAPLAFILYIMPFTESYYKQWWEQFFKWAFMGPVVALLLWITNTMIGSYLKMFQTNDPTNGNAWFILIMIAVGIYLAATIPLQMGGNPMKMVSGLMSKYGKKGLGFAARESGLSGAWGAIKAEGQRKQQRRSLALVGKVAEKYPTAARLAGITPELERRAKEGGIVKSAEETWKPLGQEGMEAAIEKYFDESGFKDGVDKREASALGLAALEGKFLDKNDPIHRAMISSAAEYSTAVENEVKTQPEWISALGKLGTKDRPETQTTEVTDSARFDGASENSAAGRLNKYLEKVHLDKPIQELGSHSVEYLSQKNPEKLITKLDPNSLAAALRSKDFNQGARDALVKAVDHLKPTLHADSQRMINELRRGGGTGGGGHAAPPRGGGQGPNSQI